MKHDEYELALARIEQLMLIDPEPDTDDGRALVSLVDCVIAYELKMFPTFAEPAEEGSQ
jgi:antitoxin component HigA of HigAB toxin-antitoxin module